MLVSLLTWLGGKELTARVSSISTETHTELSGGMRLSIDRDAFRMFRKQARARLGTGNLSHGLSRSSAASTPTSLSTKPTTTTCNCSCEMGLLGFGTMIWFLVVLYRTRHPKDRELDV